VTALILRHNSGLGLNGIACIPISFCIAGPGRLSPVKYMKTRTYLIMMAAAILLPVMVFASIGLNMLLTWERESRLRGLQETARAIALTIDREVAAAESALRVASHSALIEQDDFRKLHRMLSVSNEIPDSRIVLSDYQGRQLVNTGVPYGTRLPTIGGEWAAPAFDSQKTTVSNYFVGPLTGKPTVAVNVPVPSEKGKRYVLSQRFHAEYFNKVFQANDLPANWIVGIFGSDGISIARSFRPEGFIGKPVRREVFEAARKNFSGVLLHPSRENIEIYDAYTHSERSGWIVAVGVPRDEIEAPVRRAAWFAAASLAAIFALAGIVVLSLARRLANSLELAANAAKELGRSGIPKLQSTKVREVDVLQSVLYEAGVALAEGSASRRKLEEERERLLLGEQEARKQAEAQNKAKDDFLAMLGHELRNPLSAISGAISLMEMPNAGADQIARARGIGRNQVNHLARIVDDLLDVGRIMAGKVLLRKQPLDLGEFVRRCVESQRAVDSSSHVWHVQTESVWVDADPTRLEQIIGNVLVNAAKFTPHDGSIQVEVRAEGGKAVVAVRDSGIGMSSELVPTIFEVFVQGPTTIDRTQGGLGLGLALVRQLLALHGGTVTAVSPGSGQGSTFMIRLPQCRQPLSPAQPQVAGPSAAGGKTILIVEDNEDAREMLLTVLSLDGFTVHAAGDGNEALRIAGEQRIDVALVDIGLPGMSGYEIARHFRANPQTGNVRLIALTGYGLEQDRELALQAGFSAHITKPYSIASLLEAINAKHDD
jgi:signal transduction histidine kinase/CheY-like chemotaxis protein